MIDYNAAEASILEFLATTEREMAEVGSALPGYAPDRAIRLVISEVMEQEFGWVFCYEDESSTLAGNAPLIVDKTDGHVYVTGTAEPLEHYLEQYRRGMRTRA